MYAYSFDFISYFSIYSSRERVQINIENLKKQYEFMLIEEEQKEKERSSVRSNYEIMIRNQKVKINSTSRIIFFYTS